MSAVIIPFLEDERAQHFYFYMKAVNCLFGPLTGEVVCQAEFKIWNKKIEQKIRQAYAINYEHSTLSRMKKNGEKKMLSFRLEVSHYYPETSAH